MTTVDILALLAVAVVTVGLWLKHQFDRAGTRAAMRMVDDYERSFHGCGVCGFHRYGVREGFARIDDPIEHWCWEKGRYIE